MLKKLLIAAVALVLLIAVGVLIVFMSIDSIAKSAIEKGGTYALGTKTSVSGVSVGVLKGEFSLSGLDVATPAQGGFTSPHFLSLGKGSTAVTLSTLRQPVVEIPSFALEHLDANIESKGGATNYGAILENLKKVAGAGGGDKPQPASTSEKKFIIRKITLTDIKVHVNLAAPALPGAVGDAVAKVTTATIPIERIELNDVGSAAGSGVGGSGVTMEQLSGIIVKAVLSAAAKNGGGLIPGDMLGDLQGKLGSLANLDSLTKGGAEIISGAGAKVSDAVSKGVEDAKKQAEKGVGDALKGVIPGSKKK